MSDEGSEADYMYQCQLSAWGADIEEDDPEFEVVKKNNDRIFSGSRAACWDFKHRNGGYVRPWSGEDEDELFYANT